MKNFLYKLLNYIRHMADENTDATQGAETNIPLESGNMETNEPNPSQNEPIEKPIEPEVIPEIIPEIKDPLPTPDEILNKINREIMAKEDDAPETKPTKKKDKETAPEKDGGKPDNTLIILGIAAVLIGVGLFLWLNYQKKLKALKESDADTVHNLNDDQNGHPDEREYYN